MIEVRSLAKRFGPVTAVDGLSFQAQPGRVTGFLGPNGAGKTTTLRIALGLVRASAGEVVFDGRRYRELAWPGREVGASLEASSFHPGRAALSHLRSLAPQLGAPDARCEEVLDLVGLTAQAGRRVGDFSLGMRGRLAVAAALLGDPSTLLLDEPTNGLDPEGITWMRALLRALAAQGRTVLISSHLLGEVERTVDDVVIISRGRLAHASPLEDLERLSGPATLVAPAAPAAWPALLALAQEHRWEARPAGQALLVSGVAAAEIGWATCAAGLPLAQLATQKAGLEQAYFQLTQGGGLV
ncbi:MAG: ATP-binding cassette domain-containing protein [Bifidobacteriaceae bacterium]|jgi:ABC-2 type transport system ATP-binding protein|nr:ATP-binding cassette domain-containing protein [Bifidobacteriaceae bacterium]